MQQQVNGFNYWGKARPTDDSSAAYHPLPWHCLDVAAVGVEVLDRMPALAQPFAARLQLEAPALRSGVAFWLALHDLGKFAESFQSQCPDVFGRLRGRSPNPAKRYTLRHDSLGMLFWKDVLCDRVIEQAWFGPGTEDLACGLHWWARACTGHHGQPPTEGDSWKQHFDAQQDRSAALAFADDMRDRLVLEWACRRLAVFHGGGLGPSACEPTYGSISKTRPACRRAPAI